MNESFQSEVLAKIFAEHRRKGTFGLRGLAKAKESSIENIEQNLEKMRQENLELTNKTIKTRAISGNKDIGILPK